MVNVHIIVFVHKFVRVWLIHKYFPETTPKHFHPFCIFIPSLFCVMSCIKLILCHVSDFIRVPCVFSSTNIRSINGLFWQLFRWGYAQFSLSAYDPSPEICFSLIRWIFLHRNYKERTQNGFCFVRCSCRTKKAFCSMKSKKHLLTSFVSLCPLFYPTYPCPFFRHVNNDKILVRPFPFIINNTNLTTRVW